MNATKATMNVCCFRTFGLIAALAAVLLPVQAHALSLGGFQVDSALDEPLRGEIQLESVDAETLESLEVTLGSTEDFRRADVPRQEFLNQLQFTVTETPDGGALVEVTSEQPMKEPFLHFLVSVEWSGGKLIREYTGLLDPPLYAGESPAQVESPAVGTAEATPEMDEPSEPAAAPAAAETGTVAATAPSSDAGAAEYGPTQEGDTLWGIASRLDTGAVQANVFQIMIALQRQNPDAFIDNNINRLRTGAVLRLDDIAAVADISADQASAAYTAQLEEWQSYRSRVASAEAGGADTTTVAASTDSASAAAAEEGSAQAGEATEAASETATAQAAAETGATPETASAAQTQAQAQAEGQDDVLRIVQATVDESQQSAGAGAGTGADQSGEIAELRGQVATLQESLESRNLENEELRERVRLLESQLENAQRLIEIESQELAAAQEQAAQAQQQAAQAQEQASQAQAEAEAQMAEAGAAGQSEPMAGDSAGDSEQMMAEPVQPVEEAGQEQMASASTGEDAGGAGETDTAGAAASSDSGDASTAQETQSSQQASTAGSAAADSGQSGDDTQRVRTTAGGAAQGAWWTRITDMLFSSWMWMVGAAIGVLVLVLGLLMFLRRRQSIAEFEESILSGSALDSYSETSDTAASSASDTSFLSDFGTAGMGTMQADEVDPLAEAEVYLAYGRDEQAEDVLKEAARRDPERAEVKLKLLEIYKQRNDVKSFETIAEELYPAGDSGDRQVWNQVTAMGRELSPGNPLFQESAATGGTPAPTPEAPAAGSAEAASQGAGEAPEAMNFNFDDLGGQAPEQDQAPAASAAPAGGTQAGNELDFDLDTGMAPESETPAPAAASRGDESTLDFGEDFLQQPSGSVDPATQPFPAPDQQTDLDRELERLAGEREATAVTPPDDAQAPAAGADQAPVQAQQPDWERADDDSGTLDFPTSDTADIDFDLNLDDNSIQQLTGSDAPREAADAQASGDNDQSVSDASLEDLGEGLLEFESENIPPEETWAGASSDAAPASGDEPVAYSPSDDVQSAGAPEYNEAETKLDLARAYLDMGDKVGARSIIDEVMREGDPAQRDQAAELASQL